MSAKRCVCLFAAVLSLFLLTACAPQEPEIIQDTSPLTMYVGLGNANTGYYEKLREVVLEETGIELEYIYSNTADTTNAVNEMLKNGELPADIVITAIRLDAELQQACFLDLAAYTNVPDSFTSSKIQEVSVSGAVYQLPYSSRLIGVEYNKTLLDEMGWTLPDSFEGMKELKQTVEDAGYQFAVCGGAATGHGFNYLFHIMGSDYLSTPAGTEWFECFRREGTADVTEFAEKSEYFRKYVEAGLFGTVHDADWNAKTEFARERILFYYNTINDIYSYDGFRYNDDGTLYGVEYGGDGLPVAIADPEGEAVFYGDEYVLYDPENEAHDGLERYTLPGAVVLHDEYASMPWISEDGNSNCFTAYDNMFVALDKKLADPAYQDKLDKACSVLAFMASDRVTALFSEMYPDGYVAVNGYEIDDSRLYYDYRDSIAKGYIAHWYYNDFDSDTIVYTGEKINDYIKGAEGSGLDVIMAELEQRNENYLNGTVDVIASVPETLGYAHCAEWIAVSNALSCQQALDSAGAEETVTAALMPYTNALSDLPVSEPLPLVQAKVYAGELEQALIRMYIPTNSGGSPVVIRMTGEELREIAGNGYSILADYGIDRTFPYAVALKGSGDIDPTAAYNVAVPLQSLESAVYEAFLRAGKVLSAGDEPICGNTEEGILLFAEQNGVISAETIAWD